ncbi:MAG: CDP-glycerol glycerophosphotransferase family protein, partial [Lachnospiraceae bacterium]|nr:CDP-glycerol glycerophosphotransferase family protein [Lachnospiraceae bacterium]
MKFVFGYHYKHSQVVDNRILFESFHGSTVSDSPLYILKELLSREDAADFEIYYATNTNDIATHREFLKANNMEMVKLIPVSAYKYNKILATSKYLINNSSFPVYFIKKEEQIYLQTWHGTPLKTLGKQMRMGIESMYNVQHNFLQATYLMHPNEFTKNAIMGDYNLETLYTGKVYLSGYPRNSIFMDKEAGEKLREKLGLKDKVVYAYMPTWRGTSNHAINQDNYSREVTKMLKVIDKKLKDNQLLYVNFHPILKGAIKIEGLNHVKQFPSDVNNYEFLNCVDALVTDYSSVFFDFSVTRKPIILFMYDYNEYMNDRGMYMDIRELPFVKIYKTKELAEWLSEEKILTATYDDGEYVDKFIKYDSLDAPAKMLDLVLYGKEDGMEVFDYSKNKDIKRRVIHPVRIKTREDFETIKNIVKPNDIVLLEKKYFSKAVSAMLYDFYNDIFDYVIITNTTPRTFIEDFFRLVGGKKTTEVIAKRELKRTFPNLDIEMPYIEDFYVAEEKNSISDTEVIYVKAKLLSDGKEMTIKFMDSDNYKIKQYMVFDAKGGIIRSRPLGKRESSQGEIKEDFQLIKSRMNMGDRYEIGGEFEDKKTGICRLGMFYDPDLNEVNEKNVSKKIHKDSFLAPVTVEGLGSKKNIAKFEKGFASIIPIPYTKSFKNGFSLFVCKPGMVVNEYLHADISSIKS